MKLVEISIDGNRRPRPCRPSLTLMVPKAMHAVVATAPSRWCEDHPPARCPTWTSRDRARHLPIRHLFDDVHHRARRKLQLVFYGGADQLPVGDAKYLRQPLDDRPGYRALRLPDRYVHVHRSTTRRFRGAFQRRVHARRVYLSARRRTLIPVMLLKSSSTGISTPFFNGQYARLTGYLESCAITGCHAIQK